MRVPYGIFLGWNNAESWFRLPVNPEALEIKQSGEGRTYDIVGLGEINAIQAPRLREISFSGIFPSAPYPYVQVGTEELRPPLWYVERLTEWMQSKRPIRLVVAGSQTELVDGQLTGVQLNSPVSIERFDWKESALGGGDVEYELALKAYVFYAAKKVHVITDPQQGGAVVEEAGPLRANDRVVPTVYTMGQGESLWSIAAKLLGNGARYGEIQALNGISDAELRSLPAGRELKLPGEDSYV
ncbi:LysM peptidoglycan-binding domain-containing protein [Paenibacillus puerhi]|uniref:LysM peptidoglycan-binding domain-containing protein n=1 Tax=Paenibacillus puerhi TaxID=2692622 RepID=UPI001358326E|nr:LysM peptidoglycan-binding domain-containing protein [Paenibacillus puerhi]